MGELRHREFKTLSKNSITKKRQKQDVNPEPAVNRFVIKKDEVLYE